jgi:hypothetical protein
MKAKLVQWTKPLLTACMALSLWFTYGATSIIFFGEYEYPKNPEE